MKRTKGMSGIYQILNKVNGKRYIGSAVNIKIRKSTHIRELKQGIHPNTYLQRSWNKYGEETFSFSVVLYCNRKDLIQNEQNNIDKYKRITLYNLSPTASNNLGVKFSQKTKDKISASQKGKIIPLEQRKRISQTLKGNIPWNKGIPMTVETKVKLSRELKGRKVWNKGTKLSKEGKLKLSIAHLGYDMPEEQRKKISEAMKKHLETMEHWNKGFNHSEETKRRIANFQKGSIRSEETRNRMSESKKGHIVSDETRRKISETKIARRVI